MGFIGSTNFRPDNDASLNVSTYALTNGNKALSFQCNRFTTRDPRMNEIYQDALKSRAKTSVNPFCEENNHFGDCGNTRGYLTECRCPILNRETHNAARREYENDVINSVVDLIKKEKLTHIKLVVFCSGRLLGEEILLFRLFDRLQREKFKGTIELFFIDTEYQTPIARSTSNGNLEQSVGGAKYIEQFLQEISLCLPEDITLKGTFFGHSDDYLAAVSKNQQLKHHLTIGADVMSLYTVMGPVGKAAGIYPHKKPIALVHAHNTPEVCSINQHGQLEDCKDVSEPNVNGSNVNVPLVCAIAGFVFVGLLAGGFYLSQQQGKGKGKGKGRGTVRADV